MANDNILPFLLQNALSRAYPSQQASNQVLYQFALESDTTVIQDNFQASAVPSGYPYGWGECISLNIDANGIYQYEFSDINTGFPWDSTISAYGSAWILKLSSYQPSGSDVQLSVQLNTSEADNSNTVCPSSSPAQVSFYADICKWMLANYLGCVGINPWGTPSNWNDNLAWWMGPETSALTAISPAQWMLKTNIFCTNQDNYSVYCAADAQANVFIDGVFVLTASGTSNTSSGTISLVPGIHQVTIEVLNAGTAPNPTGCLISIQDSKGNVIENGSSQNWQTSGLINQAWSYSSGIPLLTDSWYVIPSPPSDTVVLTLNVSGTPQAILNSLLFYTVAPWKWDKGGKYDASPNATLPVNISTVGGQ